MLLDRIAGRHFQRGPESPFRWTGLAVSNHDVTGKRIAPGDETERVVGALFVDLPRDQRSLREIRRQERLSHAANRPRFEHRADALDDGVGSEAGAASDLADRIANESPNLIFGDLENLAIHGIARRD